MSDCDLGGQSDLTLIQVEENTNMENLEATMVQMFESFKEDMPEHIKEAAEEETANVEAS